MPGASLSDMTASILLTGADGFTGHHFARAATERGYRVIVLRSNLTDAGDVLSELAGTRFDYVVHLAAISAVTHENSEEIYRVNLFGTLNLLTAIGAAQAQPAKILLVSSANVYGNCLQSPIDETVCPDPVNHYAMSKLAMEKMAKSQAGELPLLFVRPFNYTGVGHDQRFVIPKIVAHYARGADVIELGNTEVEREFNDVRTVCSVYLDLLEGGEVGEIYNVCSGSAHSLNAIITLLNELSGQEMQVEVNPAFLRSSELARLSGNPAKLEACIGAVQHTPLDQLLDWMLRAAKPE